MPELHKERLPIASFDMRVIIGRKTLASAKTRDKQFNYQSDSVRLDLVLLSMFSYLIIEIEFLDLKTASPNGSEPCSIWSEKCIQNTSSLGKMLSESIHTDITILASDGSIGAHRAVLATRSPVFNSMFTHDLQEKELSAINISDMSIEVCQAFLNYLYSNNIPYQHFITHRLDLLKAADKYDVSDLKDACQDSLIEDIDSTNVLERLQTAFMYRLPRLKFCCIQYLVKFQKILDIKEEFISFMQSADREFVSEVFNQFLTDWTGF
ncbi:SKP1/BTB/POZ domain-containing protein [Artemisia annua]|uniref:SKP1/BTB/POZ domain-containing protein n=1 Tax=Artemisia annua TaxID=35608 RepID=A0A2U1NWZ1_ARTAN|nr:SKP1/BTB/POZ domain-containing protein [Artemisia annua]